MTITQLDPSRPTRDFDTRDFPRHGGRVIALKPIRAGDELTFFYPATEWAMDRPFDCRCRSGRCLGQVQGASQLPAHVLQGHRLSPHIETLKHGGRGQLRTAC